MSARWNELEEPWRLAFEQAVAAYLAHASTHARWVEQSATAQSIFDHVSSLRSSLA